jgi:parvulin-like peptidyl-prolyl isomerase
MATKSTADGGEAQTDETCDDCGLALADAHEQPAGYVRLTTDGERICGACDTIRRGYQRRDRKTADELASDDGDERHGGDGLRKTADELAAEASEQASDDADSDDTDDDPRGVVDPYVDRVAEREAVDETPL